MILLKNEDIARGEQLKNNLFVMTFHDFYENHKRGNNISATGPFFEKIYETSFFFMKRIMHFMEKSYCMKLCFV